MRVVVGGFLISLQWKDEPDTRQKWLKSTCALQQQNNQQQCWFSVPCLFLNILLLLFPLKQRIASCLNAGCWRHEAQSHLEVASTFLFSCLIWPLLRADNRNWVSSTANNIHLLWYFGPICFLLAWVVLRSLYQGKYGNNSGWEGVFFLLSRVLDQWLELEMFWFWFWLPEPCSSISEVFSNNIQLLFMSPPPATTHRCPDCAGNLPGDAEGTIIRSLPSNYLHSNFRRLFPPPIYFQTRSKEIVIREFPNK